ncbi:hypothetical protein IWC96_04790 [Brevundimonas sp. BAL450]|uniref:hypothetical protein n=1 Tax=Brevundimonas TaxID=41275 RepID=UPI0011D2630C|nr:MULTISPECIES: hypothetical protein [Brevundimonas]MBG7614600.1 hypothetical protein [Brevundimonas sp. BAL450]
MTFIELTHEDGHRIILSMDEIAQIAPLGGDEQRGCAVTFKRRGTEATSRHIRVRERLSTLSASLRPMRPRTRAQIGLSWTFQLPEPRQSIADTPTQAVQPPTHLHPVPRSRFSAQSTTLDAANRS